jgi:hypothetical protein
VEAKAAGAPPSPDTSTPSQPAKNKRFWIF